MPRPSSCPRRYGRRQRGAALVETALMMLVLIPLILYAIFLMDAAYMKLDLQETVVSGIWDFSTRTLENSTDDAEREKTMRAVRASYSDHTSAFEDGAEVDPDVAQDYGQQERITGNHQHEKHHKTYFAAQYTFQWEGADTQFLCFSDDDPADIGRSYGGGGYVRCEATGFIYNYIIPESLFTQFSDVRMSNLIRRKGDSHQFQGGGGNTANIKAFETAAVSFNTWALRNGSANGDLNRADIGVREGLLGTPSDVDGPFYSRVVANYTDKPPDKIYTYTPMRLAAFAFTAKAASTSDALGMFAPSGTATMRDIVGLPNPAGVYLVARYQPGKPQDQTRQKPAGLLAGSHDGFQSTPYRGVNNDYVTAYGKRGPHYMGCKDKEKGPCQ